MSKEQLAILKKSTSSQKQYLKGLLGLDSQEEIAVIPQDKWEIFMDRWVGYYSKLYSFIEKQINYFTGIPGISSIISSYLAPVDFGVPDAAGGGCAVISLEEWSGSVYNESVIGRMVIQTITERAVDNDELQLIEAAADTSTSAAGADSSVAKSSETMLMVSTKETQRLADLRLIVEILAAHEELEAAHEEFAQYYHNQNEDDSTFMGHTQPFTVCSHGND